MKWGKRNGPPYPLDASNHSASEKKAGWRKSLSDEEERYGRQEDRKTYSSKERKKANAVRKYVKDWDKAEKLSNRESEAWEQVRKEYKSLAKTPIGRIKEVNKAHNGKGSIAAKKYLESWDKAEKLSDEESKAWEDVRKQYKALGRTFVGRIIAVSMYDE